MKAMKAVFGGVGALLLGGMLAVAQGPGMGPGMGFGAHRPPMERAMGPMGQHGRWWNNPKVVEQLKLTDQQRKDMDAILQQHRENLIDLHANVEKAEVAMDPLIQADQPNESAILAQIDKVAQARAELEKGNARFLLALRAKLTPDQWKTLQAMRMERHDRRDWGAGRRGRGPAGRGPNGPGPNSAGPGAPAAPPASQPQ